MRGGEGHCFELAFNELGDGWGVDKTDSCCLFVSSKNWASMSPSKIFVAWDCKHCENKLCFILLIMDTRWFLAISSTYVHVYSPNAATEVWIQILETLELLFGSLTGLSRPRNSLWSLPRTGAVSGWTTSFAWTASRSSYSSLQKLVVSHSISGASLTATKYKTRP